MLTQHYLPFFVIFLGGLQIYSVAIIVTYQVFFIQISTIHGNISSRIADKGRDGLGQWMNWSIIHDNIRSLVHKCHLKSYHSDLKYIWHYISYLVYYLVEPFTPPHLVVSTFHWIYTSIGTLIKVLNYQVSFYVIVHYHFHNILYLLVHWEQHHKFYTSHGYNHLKFVFEIAQTWMNMSILIHSLLSSLQWSLRFQVSQKFENNIGCFFIFITFFSKVRLPCGSQNI